MLRAAFHPKSILLLVFALGLASLFAALGSWQWQRAHRVDPAATSPETLPLHDVLVPQQSLGGDNATHPLSVTGRYDPTSQLSVVGRHLEVGEVTWVLARLIVPVNGQQASLPVIRGYVAAGQPLPDPPTGEVRLEGWMQLGDGPPPSGAPDISTKTVVGVSDAQLVKQWGAPIYAGYLLRTQSSAPEDQALDPVPLPKQDAGYRLLNLSYALQWFVFAGFAIWMWWRIVRDRFGPDAGDDLISAVSDQRLDS